MSIHRQQLEGYLKKLDIKAKCVLDVGGSQLSIVNRVNSFKADQYLIADLPTPHEMKMPVDVPVDLNVYGYMGVLKEKNIQPDVIFCMEVMEYIWNPVQALATLYEWLSRYGVMYISFSFVYPVHEPKEQDYLRYTKAGAEKLLDQAGFKVIECYPLTFKDHRKFVESTSIAEGMRASKTYQYHDAQGFIYKVKK